MTDVVFVNLIKPRPDPKQVLDLITPLTRVGYNVSFIDTSLPGWSKKLEDRINPKLIALVLHTNTEDSTECRLIKDSINAAGIDPIIIGVGDEHLHDDLLRTGVVDATIKPDPNSLLNIVEHFHTGVPIPTD